MNLKKYATWGAATFLTLGLAACGDDDIPTAGNGNNAGGNNGNTATGGRYVLGLGVSSSNATSYYLVTAADLMKGTISSIGNGVEQTGYRDFQQGGQTIFSIGGLGIAEANGFTLDADGKWQKKGNFVFDASLNGFEQVDSETMLGVEFPKTPQDGDVFKFYTVPIDKVSITRTLSHPVTQLGDDVTADNWPSFTGMRISGDKVYLTYYLMHPVSYATPLTDRIWVAVYSYPGLEYIATLTDKRVGPAGAFNTNCGILSDEKGDLYTMSATAKGNGFTQSSLPAGFLRIKKGETAFDETYYFDFEKATGGYKPAHIKYIGNGLAFAEVTTRKDADTDLWSDAALKLYIVDLYNQTAKEVDGAPVHNGQGARSFTALVEEPYVYLPITLADGTFVYRTHIADATAEKGAEVQATFVGGLFKLN